MTKPRIGSALDAARWPHTDKRQEVPVEGVAHLYLVIQPHPSTVKSWAWRAAPKGGGKLTKVTLGSLADHKFAAAIIWAERRNADREAGRDERAERHAESKAALAASKAEAERKQRTIEWFWNTYYKPRCIDVLKQPAESHRLWKKFIQPAIGHMAMSDVDHDDLARITSRIYEKGPTTANRATTMLCTMFKRASTQFRTQTGLKVNPAIYLMKPHDEARTRKQRYLNRRELGYVLSVLDRSRQGRGYRGVYAKVLWLIINTGVRIREALEAPWSEFDLDTGEWLIAAERTKNGLSHLIMLGPDTLSWLKEEVRLTAVDVWRIERDLPASTSDKDILADPEFQLRYPVGCAPATKYVFSVRAPERGKAAQREVEKHLNSKSKPQSALLALTVDLAKRDRTTMADWSAHALRRTFSTELSSLTDDDLTPLVPPHVVEALLNHQSGAKASVAGIYNKYQYKKEKAASLKLWEAHLAKVLAEERARERKHREMEEVAA